MVAGRMRLEDEYTVTDITMSRSGGGTIQK
jgi:hypothetical protein